MTRRHLELYVIGLVRGQGNAVAARAYAMDMQTIDVDGVEFWTEVANYIGAASPVSRRAARKAA